MNYISLIYRILAIALVISITACSSSQSSSPEEVMASVDDAINRGDWDKAQNLLDSSIGEGQGLTAAELGRVSILYMRLSDNTHQDENVATATQFYLKAFAAQPDSALAYYTHLPLEESQYVELLSNLSRAITSPPQLSGDTLWEGEDSIAMYQHDHPEN